MSNGTRIFLILAGLFMVVTTVTVVGAGVAVYQAGSIEVDVRQQNGTDFSMRLPAGVVHVALGLVPDHVVDEIRGEFRREFPEGISGVESSLRQLRNTPDFTLAQVNVDGTEVRVHKTHNRIVVDVADGPDRVHVSVPMETLLRILGQVDLGPAHA